MPPPSRWRSLKCPRNLWATWYSCCSRGSSMSSIGPAARTRCSASSACPSLCTDGRNLILLVVVVFVLYLATLAVLAFRRSRTGVVIADDGVTWPDTLRTISAILGIGNFPLPLINSCQTFVSIAAVVSELKDIAALIESCLLYTSPSPRD